MSRRQRQMCIRDRVQLGRDQYAERLKRLEELLPGLIKEHPEIKSIDLRYPDRVTLVP